MGVHIWYKKLLITTETQSFPFDFPKEPDIGLKYEVYSKIYLKTQ